MSFYSIFCTEPTEEWVFLFRYLACVMEIATPTEDCLVLINELLLPIFKARDENSLSRQEVDYLSNFLTSVSFVR